MLSPGVASLADAARSGRQRCERRKSRSRGMKLTRIPLLVNHWGFRCHLVDLAKGSLGFRQPYMRL